MRSSVNKTFAMNFAATLSLLTGVLTALAACSSEKKAEEVASSGGSIEGNWKVSSVSCAQGTSSFIMVILNKNLGSNDNYLKFKFEPAAATATLKITKTEGNSCTGIYPYSRSGEGSTIKLTRLGDAGTYTKEGTYEECSSVGMKDFEFAIAGATWVSEVNGSVMTAIVQDNETLNTTACGASGKTKITFKRD